MRYAVAVCSVAAGLGFRFVLAGALDYRVRYITFFPAIMFAAWFGGLGPGILATALSLAAAFYFVVEPLSRFWIRQCNWRYRFRCGFGFH